MGQTILIVGGGISGLALAFRLEQTLPDATVQLLEKDTRVGGTISTVEKDGFRVELGPNGFLDNNPATMSLCTDLGIQDQLLAASETARKNRFLFLNQKMHRLPSSLFSFLTTNLLSWRAKLSILTERFRSPRPELVDESIEAFAKRRTNAEIAEKLVDAFVTGIHAGDPGLLSVRAAFPRLANLEKEYGSVLGGMSKSRRKSKTKSSMRTWSFKEGLGKLPSTIRQQLRTPPIQGVKIRSLYRDDQQWIVRGEGRDEWRGDTVVLTCPAYEQASILADLDETLAEKIADIAYNCIAVVALGFHREQVRHPLDGFGYLSPGRAKRDVLGVQWCSTIFPDRAPQGKVLIRAMCGGWHRPEMVHWSDQRLIEAVQNELRLTLEIESAPIFRFIKRWERAIPQYHLGHLTRVAWIDERRRQHPGLYLGGNCYRGVALNDCTDQAGMLASEIAQSVRLSASATL